MGEFATPGEKKNSWPAKSTDGFPRKCAKCASAQPVPCAVSRSGKEKLDCGWCLVN